MPKYVKIKIPNKKKKKIIFSQRKEISKLPLKVQIKKTKKKLNKKAFILQKDKTKKEKWKNRFSSFASGF